MKKAKILRFFIAAIISSWLCFNIVIATPAPSSPNPYVLILDVDGAIGPAMAEYVENGIAAAEQREADLLLVRLDTPGGLDAAMRSMIKAILASSVPVAVYVAPEGARAASAGTYLLYAAHVAAMAPATNTGSATPVQIGGMPGMPDQQPTKPGPAGKSEQAELAKETPAASKTPMTRKIENDAVAYIRSLAEFRGRNVQWAEEAVLKGENLSAQQALEKNVIDIMANNVQDLLAAIDGKVVKMSDGSEHILVTKGATIELLEPDWRTQFLSVLTNPNIAYMLMLLGFYGLIYEFINPGMFVPGVVGAICIVLALYALQVLPINYAGLALIVLGIVFMGAEAFAPSFGILGIGGIAAFVVGSIILLDNEGYSISLSLILGNAAASALLFIWVLGMVIRIRRRPLVSGQEQMIGKLAEVSDDFTAEGYVQVMGERWQAVSASPVRKGQKVRVVGVNGLVLKIES